MTCSNDIQSDCFIREKRNGTGTSNECFSLLCKYVGFCQNDQWRNSSVAPINSSTVQRVNQILWCFCSCLTVLTSTFPCLQRINKRDRSRFSFSWCVMAAVFDLSSIYASRRQNKAMKEETIPLLKETIPTPDINHTITKVGVGVYRPRHDVHLFISIIIIIVKFTRSITSLSAKNNRFMFYPIIQVSRFLAAF